MQPVLARMILNRINGENIYDDTVIRVIDELSKRYTGFEKFAEVKGLKDRKEFSIEELARLMPYYYS